MKPRAFSYLRMSTAPQLDGDSRRRQLEASRAYARENGLELAEADEYKDIGVSAFRGDNLREGSLGSFLQAIEAKKIAPGSYLIVESLDRLSREQILEAQALFLRIVRAGINLVTLIDRRVYRAGQVELGDLIYSMVSMSRAHDESLTKSHRLSAAWANKRACAGQRPMTEWCPAWLKLAEDRSRYVEIPERVEVVRQIFEDSVSGVGLQKQASRLNETGVPTFGSPNGWHHTYIAKILANRSVLGEFQPHVREGGKRVPKGEPVRNYFPAIIDEQLFYRAQVAKAQRKISGKGRKGDAYSNLFSGLGRCAYCGSKVLYENKGDGPKGGAYLVCDSTKRKLGCPSTRWRYLDFEASFLRFVEEIELATVVNSAAQNNGLRDLDNDIVGLRGELAAVSELMEKTYSMLNGDAAMEFIKAKLNEHATRKAALESAIRTKSVHRDELAADAKRRQRSSEELRALIKRIQHLQGQDAYALRAKVASHLATLIDHVKVGAIGYRPREAVSPDHREAYYLDQYMRDSRFGGRRYFWVAFRSGRVRVVYPKVNAPFEYDQLLFTRREGDPDYQTEEEIEAEQAQRLAAARSLGLI
ncbi:recombinase family protein [Bradyrhizobium diazoefficiens]|uniref:recombinase family protein n=2 Tax=Bradyrhizobium TaxID=374 RepID=UPI000D73F282|nr:recombinase family protein [Bradyrhizobium diazoefficiens]AWO87817.1 recombinase family protein [Bradyrhizobium diazoefficiens]